MRNFRYEALDTQGQARSGALQAQSEALALAQLAAQGLRVFGLQSAPLAPGTAGAAGSQEGYRAQVDRAQGTSPSANAIHSVASSTHKTGFLAGLSLNQWAVARPAVRAKERVWLMDELATLLECGVPLAEGMDSLQQGHGPTPLGVVLGRVNVALRSGGNLSEVLGQGEGSALGLPRYVTELVRAGETTGRLAQACRAAAAQMQDDEALAREVRSAMVYPAVLMASGLLAMLVVFVFVVPKFASILSNPKAQLPWVSQVVLQSGLWLTQHLVASAVAAAAALVLGWWAWSLPALRQALWDGVSALPGLGRWLKEAEMHRYSAMLALLTQNKVNLLQALAQAGNTLRGKTLAAQGQAVQDAVRQGQSLSQALQQQAMLDAPALALVRTGERSGALDRALASLAGRFRQAMQSRLRTAITLLEPLMILLISVLLGTVMISVILAVTSLTNVI